ncbi:MAG: ABC transporter permease, partial [Saprospiraceae bacterium]|nr:ABC transporter permease [Saprospiraceae bacterium]
FIEEKITYVDPGFLQIFDFPVVNGQSFAEGETESLLLSKEKAIKLYGRENPIGKIISVKLNGQDKDFKITGVIDAASHSSSIQFDFLVHMDNMRILVGEDSYQSYNYGMVENYILTNQLIDSDQLAATLTSVLENRLEDDPFKTLIGVKPLVKIHLENKITGNAKFTNPQKLYIVGGLSLLVITIAVINFIILSTSQSLHRSKEMGLRCTLGAQKFQLRKQMISESFFLVTITGIFGILLAALASPYFSSLIDGEINWSIRGQEVIFFMIICMLISLINGNLQAVFLLKHNAIDSFRGHFTIANNSTLNQILLGVQIIFSIILLMGAMGMRAQMRFIQNKDLGFEKERLLEINLNGPTSVADAKQIVERFRTEVLRVHEVRKVSASMNNVKEPWTQLGFEQNDGKTENIFYNQVDPFYISTMDMTIVQGEDFRADAPNANNAILVNETLVKHFGWKDPLKEQLPGKFSDDHQIIGVVKDFHFSTMHQKIEPLVLALDINSIGSGITGLTTYIWPANLYQILVRVGPGDLSQIIRAIEARWKEIFPEKAFVFHFFDDSIQSLYQDDLRWTKLINLATLFAVIIAGMGLLGLMRLSLQKRRKEIGIRRVLGATTHSVITLLARQYLVLIAIGNLIAIPLVFIYLKRWLDDFSYRIDLHLLPFVLAGITILLLSFVLLGLQSLSTIRSALHKALKEE